MKKEQKEEAVMRSEVEIPVEGMTCASCVRRVEKALGVDTAHRPMAVCTDASHVFCAHCLAVVTRRTKFRLAKARKRGDKTGFSRLGVCLMQ